MTDIQATVWRVLESIQERNLVPKKEIATSARIVKDLGLSSLDVAELIAVLEMEIGVDPFSNGVSLMNVFTVGELCRTYDEALSVVA